jgi:endonuclease YncB( thermonuclease family)
MTDTIRGQVTNIVDGDTFDMKITHVGKINKNKYKNVERIRISDVDEPELNTPTGKKSKDKLKKKLMGKEVRCYIQARESYGRIVAKVKIL